MPKTRIHGTANGPVPIAHVKMSRCPVCNHYLSKKYRRELTPLEWQKIQTFYWMKAWNLQVAITRRLQKGKA